MLGWNGSEWFSILISAAVKSTVVLGAAWMLAFLLRGRSAAARHLIWTAAAAAVLALPLLSLSLPALHLPVSIVILPDNPGLVFRALGIAAAKIKAILVGAEALDLHHVNEFAPGEVELPISD